ncbi:dihydrolipoyl dehydrogenase [Chloroflexota bacterium]
MKQSDIVIIGGGPAGYVAAIRASQLNGKVILIEKDTLGGTCLNQGCIPTKALLHSVEILESARGGKDHGINVGEPVVDFTKMMSRKNAVINTLVTGAKYLMKSNAIEVIKGTGKVISPTEVEVENDQQETIKAARIILAPGSIPSVVPIPGVDNSGVITSNDALQLTKIPHSLLVIGGGAIGVEFATIFAKLGAKVTIVEMLPQIIPTEDHDLSMSLKKVLEKGKIKIFTNTQVSRIENGPEGNKLASIVIGEGEQEMTAELVLVAVGRKPNIEGLGLERIGIKTERGSIVVNSRMETNIPGIYAAGDAIGGTLLAHIASAEGVVAAENALGKDSVIDCRVVPRCIYTMPEVAAVGLTESQAREEGLNLKVSRFPFTANSKAVISGRSDGFVKVLSDAKSGEIFGVHIFGPQATELISEATLAIRMEATVSEISTTIHAHPTLSEAIRETALDAEGIVMHMPRKV